MRTPRFIAYVGVLGLATTSAVAIDVASPALAASGTYSQRTAIPIGQAAASAGGATITVNDGSTANPYPGAVSIAGVVGGVTDVNVTLVGVTQASPDDLDVMLVSPSGKRALVMSDAGGTDALTGTTITLDDQAAQTLPDSAAITAGSFRPANYELGDAFPLPAPDASGALADLSVFNDSNPNGLWHLFVVDDSTVKGSGTIDGWRLDVTTTGPQPYPSTITVAGAPNRITDLNVVLSGLSHTSPSDIDVLLVGPRGQQATILSDAGSDADVSGVNLILDDSAATPVSTPMGSGLFQPSNFAGVDPFPAPAPAATGDASLAVFNGTDPNGVWKLYVADDSPGDTGILANGWALQLTTIDTAAPAVRATTPTFGKTRVSRTANVTATFTEPVRAGTVTRTTVYLVKVGTTTKIRSTVTYNATLRRATLNPRATLRPHTKYRAVVSTTVKDLAGNRLDQTGSRAGLQPKTWTFTTR